MDGALCWCKRSIILLMKLSILHTFVLFYGSEVISTFVLVVLSQSLL